MDMSLPHQFGVVLEEEADHQQADMHSVHIGIGRDDYLVVAEVVHILVHVEGGLEQEQFLVLADLLLAFLHAVQRLAPEAEHGLGIHVADLGDRAAGGVSLGDKDGRKLGELVARVGIVYAAVP